MPRAKTISTYNGPFYVSAGRQHLYPYVCFHCRSCFRRPAPESGTLVRPCPRCAAPAVPLWTKFKPPARDDIDQWGKVEALVRQGFFFLSAEENYPDKLKDVQPFAERQAKLVASWRARWPAYYADVATALSK